MSEEKIDWRWWYEMVKKTNIHIALSWKVDHPIYQGRQVTVQYEQMTGPWGSLVRGCGSLSVHQKHAIHQRRDELSNKLNWQNKSLHDETNAAWQLNQVFWILEKSSCVNQHCLLNIFPFLLSNPPLTKDAETNGGQQICWQGLDGRKKHTCPPGKSLLNTAVGLRLAFPLSTHQREPIPPPTLPPPWSPVDRGFPFSHCHSSNLSTDLLTSVDLVALECSSGNVCQGLVGWFWLWPPNPPSCPDRLCCPEVSRNGRSMWLKSGQ